MRSVKGKRVLVTGGAMGMVGCPRARHRRAGVGGRAWDVNESALNDTLTELIDGPASAAGSTVEVSGYIVDVAVADTAPRSSDRSGSASTS